MAYVTYAQFAEDMQGEERTRDLLQGHAADLAAGGNEARPFFDDQVVIADRRIDAALAKGGYAPPLADPVDPVIRKIASALIADLITKSASNREGWIDGFASWANDQLTLIEEGSLPIEGAEETVEGFDDSIIEGTLADSPMFDRLQVGAPIASVFPSIEIPRRGDRDRWG